MVNLTSWNYLLGFIYKSNRTRKSLLTQRIGKGKFIQSNSKIILAKRKFSLNFHDKKENLHYHRYMSLSRLINPNNVTDISPLSALLAQPIPLLPLLNVILLTMFCRQKINSFDDFSHTKKFSKSRKTFD